MFVYLGILKNFLKKTDLEEKEQEFKIWNWVKKNLNKIIISLLLVTPYLLFLLEIRIESFGGYVQNVATSISGSILASIAIGFTCREIEGDQDQNLFNEATAYPNPTSGKLTVSFNSTTSGKYILRVTDLLGKIMLINSGVVQDRLNTQELDLGNVAKGMYLLSFEREGSKIKTMKIVVN